MLSDFHFIVYLALQYASWLPLDDDRAGLPALCRAVAARDCSLAAEFTQTPSWLSLCAATAGLDEPGASRPSTASSGMAAGGGGREFGTMPSSR